jgi:hypothetical protein
MTGFRIGLGFLPYYLTQSIISSHGIVGFPFWGAETAIIVRCFCLFTVYSNIILMKVLHCNDRTINNFRVGANIVKPLVEDVFPMPTAGSPIVYDQFHDGSQCVLSTFNNKIP